MQNSWRILEAVTVDIFYINCICANNILNSYRYAAKIEILARCPVFTHPYH